MDGGGGLVVALPPQGGGLGCRELRVGGFPALCPCSGDVGWGVQGAACTHAEHHLWAHHVGVTPLRGTKG